MKNKILALFVFLLSLSFLSASGIAVIVQNKGYNKVRRNNKNLRAVAGMILLDGDELRTGGKGQMSVKTVDGETNLFLFSKSRVKLKAEQLSDGLEKNAQLLAGSIQVINQYETGIISLSFDQNQIFFTNAELLLKNEKGNNGRLTVFSGTAVIHTEQGESNPVPELKTAYMLSEGEYISRWMNDSDLTEEEKARIQPHSSHPKNRIIIPLADEWGRILNVEFTW
ncbi:MAG: hypothetical protein WCY21_01430 [Candidatus Cloacimonadaceae bacterium]|jgi:hypothetical protein|nr:hypothetical protein [Candidatus Cloacimonadota bacterium]MDX9949065.1 hypothetical protein [Candidatus Syntrophosphaera sp.]